MRTISYSEARQNLSATMMKAVEDHAPILITRQEWRGLCSDVTRRIQLAGRDGLSTAFPANARRLMDSIDSLKSGKGTEKDIIE